jgi:hypothetical protein
MTGLGAVLAQGNSVRKAKPVAFASRTTSQAEAIYPQLDLEAMSLDFGLRRFRNYLVGGPQTIYVVMHHKPLCSIFNKNQKGSIRTDRIKLRHQDVTVGTRSCTKKESLTKLILHQGKANLYK